MSTLDTPGHWGLYQQNHIMYGDVAAWMVKALAGLRPDPAAPGFAHVIVRPDAVAGLDRAAASYDSIRGRFASAWRRTKKGLELNIEIPAGATATVWLPAAAAAKVHESGHALDQAEGVGPARLQDGRVVVEIGSGKYAFTTEP